MAMTTLPDRLLALREIVGNEYMDETARRRILAWCDEAAAALSGREAVAWTNDAENWGNALNGAGWEFLEHCPEKSVLLFNSAKPALRMAILKYAASVAATTPQGDGVVVPGHYAENVAYAATVLEQSQCAIDRHNAPALRTLQKLLTAAPSAKGVV